MTQIDKVSLPAGKTFEWKLESNPSTGYSWQINAEEGIVFESRFETSSDLCGAPGIQIVSVSSSEAGRYIVTAEYRRPWENCKPLETRKLEIEFL